MTQNKDKANIKLDSVVNEFEYNADGLVLKKSQEILILNEPIHTLQFFYSSKLYQNKFRGFDPIKTAAQRYFWWNCCGLGVRDFRFVFNWQSSFERSN